MKKPTPLRLVTLALLSASGLPGLAQGQTPAPASTPTPSADALINKLVEKGILTDKEAKDILTESTTTNVATSSKWKMSDAVKSLELFGDLRFRYEYRGANNAPGSGSAAEDYYRERFRYAFRAGVHGDLFDNFYFGVRVETSSNPRSPWVTFGDDGSQSNPTPFAKNNDTLAIGQAYLGWRPTDWYEMVVGKMPMPLYTTAMIWDTDINPEGAAEKFKFSPNRFVDLFANFGQFVYQDTNPDYGIPSSDTVLLAWQLGANVKLTKDISVKVAPVVYNYTGFGQTNLLNATYTGEGLNGINYGLTTNYANALQYNQNGLNDLLVLEIPAEVNFNIGKYKARVFGDFAYNFYGDDRARAAATAAGPTLLPEPVTGQDKAYQVGFGIGNLGLVYGQTSRKNTWEARVYWQHIEQYAVDVNIIDSDFFERANEEGVYAAFAYSFTDSIIGTVHYGYASRINKSLGTGGNNPDTPALNPIENYHLIQLDVTCRF